MKNYLLVFSLLLSFTTTVFADSNKIYTVKEILNARVSDPGVEPQYCNGQRFKPCVCAPYVPKTVQYRPAIRECSGKAGIILSGKYKHIFSIVVRDGNNADRFPATGINGCTPTEVNAGLNKSS